MTFWTGCLAGLWASNKPSMRTSFRVVPMDVKMADQDLSFPCTGANTKLPPRCWELGFHRGTERRTAIAKSTNLSSVFISKSQLECLNETDLNYRKVKSSRYIFLTTSVCASTGRDVKGAYAIFIFWDFRKLYLGYNYNILILSHDSESFVCKIIFLCASKIALIFTMETGYKPCLIKSKNFATVKLCSRPSSLVVWAEPGVARTRAGLSTLTHADSATYSQMHRER